MLPLSVMAKLINRMFRLTINYMTLGILAYQTHIEEVMKGARYRTRDTVQEPGRR